MTNLLIDYDNEHREYIFEDLYNRFENEEILFEDIKAEDNMCAVLEWTKREDINKLICADEDALKMFTERHAKSTTKRLGQRLRNIVKQTKTTVEKGDDLSGISCTKADCLGRQSVVVRI